MKKRGLTLIELVVSMTIFIIVITLSVGGFVAINKTRTLIGNMKESQQKVRVANEMIIRYAKQAEYIALDPASGQWLDLYFDIDAIGPTTTISAKRFAVNTDTGDLLYSECKTFEEQRCREWDSSTVASLLGGKDEGIYLGNTNVFTLSVDVPSVLDVKLDIVGGTGYRDIGSGMLVENAVILGSLK